MNLKQDETFITWNPFLIQKMYSLNLVFGDFWRLLGIYEVYNLNDDLKLRRKQPENAFVHISAQHFDLNRKSFQDHKFFEKIVFDISIRKH